MLSGDMLVAIDGGSAVKMPCIFLKDSNRIVSIQEKGIVVSTLSCHVILR